MALSKMVKRNMSAKVLCVLLILLCTMFESINGRGAKVGSRRNKSRNKNVDSDGGTSAGGAAGGADNDVLEEDYYISNTLFDEDIDFNITSGEVYSSVDSIFNPRNHTPEERLLKVLFRLYSPDARAGLESEETVTVEIQYTLLRIQRLDERTQVLTTTGLVVTEWTDDRLVWDPEEFDNLQDVVVPPYMVWLPEIALLNGRAEMMAQDFDRMGVLIGFNGKVHWEPGGIFSTTCDIDITFFPFDLQSCEIVVGQLAYFSQQMNLSSISSKIFLHDFVRNGEWEVLDTTVTWNESTKLCCPDIRYPYVTSTLYLKRRTLYYVVNVIIPCVMLSFLLLIGFLIPPEAGEKISCGISVLLAFTVFLLMVSETVPKTSLQMPIISIYLTSTMMLGAISLSLSILVLNVHFSNRDKDLPRWVEVVVLGLLSSFLCMNYCYVFNCNEKERRKKRARASTVQPTSRANNHNEASAMNVKVDENREDSEEELWQRRPSFVYNDTDVTAKADLIRMTSFSKNITSFTSCLESDDMACNNGHTEPETNYQAQCRRTMPANSNGSGAIRATFQADKSRRSGKKARVSTWRDVTRVLDRLFFFITLTAMVVVSAVTLTYPEWSPNTQLKQGYPSHT